MNNIQIALILVLILTASIVPRTIYAQNAETEKTQESQEGDEAAVKAAIEEFLIALGNDDMKEVRKMFLPNANIASISIKNDELEIYTASADQYISERGKKQNRKFQEPVKEFSINISQGLLALVRADATVYYEGKASHHTNDFFILMKDNGVWKILSGSYTKQPLVKGD